MTQLNLPFQYQSEKNESGLTGFVGLPLYIELAIKAGLVQATKESLGIKIRGWTDVEMVLSLILINIAGGDCITDIERLEKDAGLNILLLQLATHGMKRQERRAYEKRWRNDKRRAFPSNAAIHRFLRSFHSPEEEKKRVEGTAFIPGQNKHLQALIALNKVLIETIQRQSPITQATLDQDATLTETQKREALFCYKKFKAYQPFNTYWAEHGLVLHSEFRDGNVPAGFEQLRVFQEGLKLLPEEVTKVFLRSDSAGYQQALLNYCAEGLDPRFGVIEFAIAATVTPAFKKAVATVKPEDWHPIYKADPKDGKRITTSQEWAEVCFVPNFAAKSKKQAEYRYLAIREVMKAIKTEEEIEALELPFQTIREKELTYKLFGIVTNRRIDGNALIQWHRERCGKSEQIHNIQKEGLAGGQLPSNLFGVNAAWWQLMILSLNLNRLMQIVALPNELKERKMKALRFHVIQLPGRVIRHARQLFIRVEKGVHELYDGIRMSIAGLMTNKIKLACDTS